MIASHVGGGTFTIVELTAETFRRLVDSVQDYAIYLLAPDGTIRSWNAGAQRLKGYTSDEIIGQHFERFFSPQDRENGKPAWLMRRALAEGRAEDIGWRYRKDGSQFWASAVMTALRDEKGEHIGFAKVTRDLTDRAYRAFIEASHAIVWTTDANGRPNADSPSWREFTGQSLEDWRALKAWDTIHPDDVERFRQVWNASKETGQRLETEFRLRRADGAYVWMAVNAVPLRDQEGRVREWFGVTFDVAARKAAERERESALELWRTTLRSIGEAVISTDGRGRVRFMNAVAERLTGWPEAEAAGRAIGEVLALAADDAGPHDPDGRARHAVLHQRGNGTISIAETARPIRDPSGDGAGTVVVFRDTSAEKREQVRRALLSNATQQLIEAVDYRDALGRIARLAVPNLADWVGVHVIVGPEARAEQVAVAHVDPAKVQYAQSLAKRYPPDPAAPHGVPNVIRTGRSELYEDLSRDYMESLAVDAEHLRIIRELDFSSAMVVPLRGRAEVFGAITFVYAESRRHYTSDDLAFAEELARRAALVIERRRSEEDAENASRMKDEFLATMSHELRTPLQAIVGYASMLQRGIARDPEKAIDAILRSAHAQTRLVEDILDVSRITSGKLRLAMGPVDVAAAVRAAVDSVRLAAQARRVTLVEDASTHVGIVRGDFDRLQQVVWNLLSNAVKFTDAGGTIEVRLVRDGDVVRLTVRDTGKGIPRDQLARVFERFRQLDSSTTREHGGLGLGLAIVRYLVEAHGGTVAADSQGPGTGATFTVTLPGDVRPSAVEVEAKAGEWFATRPLRGIRILVVDDDEDVLESIADVLREAGATVTTAMTAAEALQALRSGTPHILISDIAMPVEDGHSLLRRVRALPPEKGGGVPAIALSAYARPEDVRAATEAGFQLHIHKPVRPEVLLDAVSAWARR